MALGLTISYFFNAGVIEVKDLIGISISDVRSVDKITRYNNNGKYKILSIKLGDNGYTNLVKIVSKDERFLKLPLTTDIALILNDYDIQIKGTQGYYYFIQEDDGFALFLICENSIYIYKIDD